MSVITKAMGALFCLCTLAAHSQSRLPAYEITSDTSFQQGIDNRYWQVLEDKEGKWSINDVHSQPLFAKFHNNYAKSAFRDSMVYTQWVRCRLHNSMTTAAKLSMSSGAGLTDFYLVNEEGKINHFTTGWQYPWRKKDGLKRHNAIHFVLNPDESVLIYQRKHNLILFHVPSDYRIPLFATEKLKDRELDYYQNNAIETSFVYLSFIAGLLLLAAIFNFLLYRETKSNVSLHFSLMLFFAFVWFNPLFSTILTRESRTFETIYGYLGIGQMLFFATFVRHYFEVHKHYPRWDKFMKIITGVLLVAYLFRRPSEALKSASMVLISIWMISLLVTIILAIRRKSNQRSIFLKAVLPFVGYLFISFAVGISITINKLNSTTWRDIDSYMIGACMVWAAIVFSRYLFRDYGQQQSRLLQVQVDKEKEQAEFMAKQKVELEKQVMERTEELQKSLAHLKATQSQLIQSEKMASLGELTAGIAHEIQNPLNFVNNFSEINTELLDELELELDSGNISEVRGLTSEIKNNEQKINQHGKRADAIVKNMLQHSRKNTGQKEPTSLNALCDEYLRLSYHGLRAKDKSFNATFTTDFDEAVKEIDIVPQDVGRVLLNLFNNAFYAVHEHLKKLREHYTPTVSVSTKKIGNMVELVVRDNGMGISKSVQDKIFQPFFTTKPAGQGTGLGLSLSYDIIKAHGGEMKVASEEGKGATFTMILPA